ncbi:cytochrome c biogenesis CcdA family protein, partial [Candidatus Omnitrophota bacterium]
VKEAKKLSVFVRPLSETSKKAQTRLIHFIQKNDFGIDIQFKYLVKIDGERISARGGPDEIAEILRQVIIQKYHPDKFLDYLLLLQEKDASLAMQQLNLPLAAIEDKKEEAQELLQADFQQTEQLGIRQAPVFLWENTYLAGQLNGLKIHPPFNKETARIAPDQIASGPITLEFFYSPHCHSCNKIKADFIPQLESKYQDKIRINYHDVTRPQELELKISMEQEFGIFGGRVPQVYLPTAAFEGPQAIRTNLTGEIEKILALADRTQASKIIVSENVFLDKFTTYSPAVVGLAGLADGVNPCAFATIVFFVTLLSAQHYRKKEIAYIGAAFILAVFLTYLALGIGIFQVLNKLQIFAVLAKLVYQIIAFLALALGVFSLADFIYYKRTGVGLAKKACDFRMYNRLRQLVDSRKGFRALLLLAFVNGFIIALLESACTGQVYFPTIAFVLKDSQLRLNAISYLVLYNLAFILPLVVIFILTYQGFNSERITLFANKHTGGIKLATAALFFILAAGLFVV